MRHESFRESALIRCRIAVTQGTAAEWLVWKRPLSQAQFVLTLLEQPEFWENVFVSSGNTLLVERTMDGTPTPPFSTSRYAGGNTFSVAQKEFEWQERPNRISISVVVPVFNSEASLLELIRRLHRVLASITLHFEAILVNDGSRDRSWQTIQQLAADYPWVRGINLARNYGQHNALLCGIRAARHETIVTIDDDLQHPPEQIPNLLAKMEEGFDVVYGFPQKQQHGVLRDLASEITKLALRNSMGVETARHVSAFRAFRTQTRDAFADYRGPFVSIDVLLTWGTNRFCALPVQHEPRTLGTSNYTMLKLFTHAMNMMTGFTSWPLQAANLLGFCCTGFGAAILLFVLGRYLLFGTTVPGFTFLASTIAIFSGAQLFALGIIGEYLARMHFRMMDRPAYSIREKASGGSL